MNWKSIKSAPKDGTKIDLLYPYPRRRIMNCYWEKRNMGWFWKSPTWGSKDRKSPKKYWGKILPEDQWDVNCLPNMEPTHWMPIPKMPKVKP